MAQIIIVDGDGDPWFFDLTYGKYVFGSGFEKLVFTEKQVRDTYGFRRKFERSTKPE